jgi:uncharacterized membrane protein
MSSIWAHKGVRWIALGWSAFIAENAILSENRQLVIDRLGDKEYHWLYNTLSTAACSSIAYGYFRHGRRQGPLLWRTAGAGMQLAALSLQALGLIGMSQFAPKLQLPVALGGHAVSDSAIPAASKVVLRSRCPIDFSPADIPADGIYGMKRVTRHPQLWSLGLLGLGAAFGTPFATEVILFAAPVRLVLLLNSNF